MSTHRRTRASWLLWLALLAAVVVSSGWAVSTLVSRDVGPADVAVIMTLPVTVVAVVTGAVSAVVGWRRDRHVDLVQSARDLASKVGRREGRERVRLLGDDTVPIDVEFRFLPSAGRDAVGAVSRGTLTDLEAYYRRLMPRRMVITGKDGAGKTVLAIQLVLDLLNRRADGDPVPVRVSLPGWDAGFELTGWLAALIAVSYELNPRDARALVDAGLVLPILDGLDEVDTASDAGNAPSSRVVALVSRLNQYQLDGQPGALVLTSRSQAYDCLVTAGAKRLRDAARIEIQPVTSEQAAEYLLSRAPERDRWRPVCDYLRCHPDSVLATFLSTPWRVNLAFTVYASSNDPAELLSYTDANALHTDLLAGYVSAAVRLTPWLDEVDVPYDDVHRVETDSRRAMKVQRWLRTLAILLSCHVEVDLGSHVSEITVVHNTDIVPHLLWPAAGMRKVRVVHAIVGLAVTVAAFFSVFAVLGDPGYASVPASITTTHLSLFVVVIQSAVVVALVMAAFWMGWGYRWSRPHVGMQPSVQLWPRPLAVWLWHAIQSRSYGHGFVYGAQLAASLIRCRNLAAARAVVRRRQDRARWSAGAGMGSPMDALRAYPKYILGLGLIAATFMTVAVMVGGLLVIGVKHLATSDGFSITAVAVEFLKVWWSLIVLSLAIAVVWLSATPWARYVVGVVLAACSRRNQLPLRLGRFLEWSCKAGLLRRAGATYQFRHYELQEWLLRTSK